MLHDNSAVPQLDGGSKKMKMKNRMRTGWEIQQGNHAGLKKIKIGVPKRWM